MKEREGCPDGLVIFVKSHVLIANKKENTKRRKKEKQSTEQ